MQTHDSAQNKVYKKHPTHRSNNTTKSISQTQQFSTDFCALVIH